MNNAIADPSPKSMARLAGLLYLLYIATSIVADLLGHFVFPPAPETLARMATHESLFRAGFLTSLFSYVLFLGAAWALFALLAPVNRNLALLFLLFNAAGFVMWFFSMLVLYAGLLAVSGAGFRAAYPPGQLQALADLFINLRKVGGSISMLPYGVWLLPLGYLVFRSGFLPKALGILLYVDFAACILVVLQRFLLPALDVLAYPCFMASFVAEFALALWLLVKGDQGRRSRDATAGGRASA
jgi:hypothetical protein